MPSIGAQDNCQIWLESHQARQIVLLHVRRPPNDRHAKQVPDMTFHVIRIRQRISAHDLLTGRGNLNRGIGNKEFRH